MTHFFLSCKVGAKSDSRFGNPLKKTQTFTTAAERKCNLTVRSSWLQISKAQICKSGAISNDQRGKIVNLFCKLNIAHQISGTESGRNLCIYSDDLLLLDEDQLECLLGHQKLKLIEGC